MVRTRGSSRVDTVEKLRGKAGKREKKPCVLAELDGRLLAHGVRAAWGTAVVGDPLLAVRPGGEQQLKEAPRPRWSLVILTACDSAWRTLEGAQSGRGHRLMRKAGPEGATKESWHRMEVKCHFCPYDFVQLYLPKH